MVVEVESWPYNFTQSEDFLPADQRGTVTGQLLVSDRYAAWIRAGILSSTQIQVNSQGI